MELKPLSPEFDELRKAVISSNLTTCYLVLDELISSRGERFFYDKFRREWLDVYKEIYDRVSKMKKPNEHFRLTLVTSVLFYLQGGDWYQSSESPKGKTPRKE
ncbi:MAG: hypothetical protein ABSB22_09855 [Thermodesulfobacteriota bacterium]|jgi:hypothetical protein